jgi:hypothetical protein
VQDYENDYVRFLMTKTFQKKRLYKKRGRKSSWISFRKIGKTNDVYLLSFASCFHVNERGVCRLPVGWRKVPMSFHTLRSLAI